MNKLNDLVVNVIVRADAWAEGVKQEDGSQGIEAAGAALAAAAIVTLLLQGAGTVGAAVQAAMAKAAKAIGG